MLEMKKKQSGIIHCNYITYIIGDSCRTSIDRKLCGDKTLSRHSNDIYTINKYIEEVS